MLNEMILVAVTPFSGTLDPDKNGEFPVMLQLIAGKMPDRNVLSGTLAQRAGIEIGHTYLMQVREQGLEKQFGLDFTFIKIAEMTGKNIVETAKELGKPQLINVPRPEGYENTYERKTRAIEGSRTQRIKEGNYIPSLITNVTNHENAEIIKGKSQISEVQITDKKDALNN